MSPVRRVRRVLLAGALLALVAAAAGCGAAADGRPLVVVSTNILGDVVEEVVGDQAEVVTLMQPDADPHSFEISAQQAARMRTADLVVSNGLGLEERLQQHLDAAAEEGVPTLVAGDVVEVIDYDGTDGTDGTATPDPHFWTDPGQMARVVERLGTQLLDLPGVDPTGVRDRASAYLRSLQDLEAHMSDRFARIPAEQRALVTNHHVFGYLAARFDFRVVGAVVPGGTTLAAPSASDLAGLVSAIEWTGVRAIFAESSSPDRLVRVLADEAGVDVEVVELYSESLTAAGGGAEDYLSMMHVNTERIAAGLG